MRHRQDVGAVLVYNDDRGLGVEYQPVPRPTRQPGTILVRPAAVGICGSDLELLSGALDQQFQISYPHILGHEWAGTVEEGGQRLKPGERVIGLGDLGGNQWFGVTTDGAMADVFAVPEALCLPIPDNVGDRTAALVEPFACMLNAVQRIGGVDASHTVAVFGCGALGLSAVALAHRAGAAVVALDPSPLRRDTALALGASVAIDPRADLDAVRDQAHAAVGVTAADLVIEASGAKPAQAAALELAGRDARLLYMGLSSLEPVGASLGMIQARNLRITGSTGAPAPVWQPALRLLARTGLDLGRIVSSVWPFPDCAAAVAAARDAATQTKVMLAPSTHGVTAATP